ncbi:MAG: IgGFc-binding protein [Myxococcota bacterium]
MLLAVAFAAVTLAVGCSSPGSGGVGPGTGTGAPDIHIGDGISFGDNGSSEDGADDVTPVACTPGGSGECPTDRPICAGGQCVQCTKDAECEGSDRCVGTTCVAAACTTGTTLCDGSVQLTCNRDGTGWDSLSCPGECLDGACVGCTAGDRVCNGTTIMECKTDGSTYEPVDVCQAGQVCGDGACLDCFPSARRCSDTGAAQECDTSGHWGAPVDCSAQGLSCLLGTCVSPCVKDPKSKSNSGCDYWAVDMDNHYNAQNGPYAVIISNMSAQTATVKVTRKDSAAVEAALVLTRDVAPGGLEVLSLPNRNMGAPGIFWTAYRVESSQPIIAYQFNPLSNVDVFSNDASLLIPANTFGMEYVAVSRFQFDGGGPDPSTPIPYRGEIDVIASGTGTDVTVTPTARTQAGTNMQTMMPGQSYTYALEPYQVLNIKSDATVKCDGHDPNKAGACDLTGTIITATRPVAVFAGHEAAISSDTCCADHLEHQMFPVATWGSEYIAAKTKARGVESDYWRIVASQDDTQVTFTPASVSPPKTLGRGEWLEVKTPADFVVTASKPIMLAQTLASSGEVVSPYAYSDCTDTPTCAPNYSCELVGDGIFDLTSLCFPPACFGENDTSCPGGHVCACFDSGECRCAAVGDPTLILVPPQKQFRKDYVFLTPDKYAHDYVNLVAPSAAAVTLDGATVAASSFSAIPGSDWKVARLEVGDGVHSVLADQPIGVIVYGYDRDVSYGYAAGLNLVDE